MPTLPQAMIDCLRDSIRSRLSMRMEILALRHQLARYLRTARRPRFRPADRIFWIWLTRVWSSWRGALAFVQPQTVIAWRQRKFREQWTKLSRTEQPGRPSVPTEVRDLIRRMSTANPLRGAHRIVGELAKIGIEVAKSTVEKYMVRHRKPLSPNWRAFLKNHVKEIVAVDFFVVPIVRNQVLFVFHEGHLRRMLSAYFDCCHRWRVHRSLEMDCPEPRVVHAADRGNVVQVPEVGRLHHHHERVAA